MSYAPGVHHRTRRPVHVSVQVIAGANEGGVTAYTGPSRGTYSQAYGICYVGSLPLISITSPTDGATVGAGTVPVTANAQSTMTGGTITKVDFYAAPSVSGGGYGTPVAIGEATAPVTGTNDYTINWNNAQAGNYALTAIATDSYNLTGTSTANHISVSTQPVAPTPIITVTGTSTGTNTFTGIATSTISIDPSITPGLNVAGGPVVYYTIDGSAPNPATSARYTSPFTLAPANGVSTTYTVRAQSFQIGHLPSTPVTQTVTVNPTTHTTGAPTAIITSPADGAEAMGQVPIVGTTTGPAFGYWQLDYQFVSSANDTTQHPWTRFAYSTTPVIAGTLTTMDTSLMLDGQYNIRLTTFDTDGQAVETENYVVIKGHQKIGYFTLSYTDMTIPIAGIPISVTRTYDSRDKTPGDFGIGWKLSTTDVKVQKPEISTFNWEQYTQQQGFSLAYYVQPVRAHDVTITLPGDQVYSFAETLNPNYELYNSMADNSYSQVIYQQLSGPKATLTPADAASGSTINNTVWIASASDIFVDNKQDPNLGNYVKAGSQPVQLLQDDLETPYEPTAFVLTLHNGVKYLVDTQGHLKSITDRNGNVITFDASGIHDAGGRSIQVSKTGQYITSITDMMNHSYTYQQNGAGDLVTSTDRVGNTTTYDYDSDHNLTDIKNPLGIMPIRNYYYPDGRLNYTLDAQGHEVDNYYPAGVESSGSKPPAGYDIPVDANGYLQAGYQVVTDALGNPTLARYDSYGNVTEQTQYLTDTTHSKTPVKVTYTFGDTNNPDKPTRVVDPMGNAVDSTYDSAGSPLSITRYLINPNGSSAPAKIQMTYDEYGGTLSGTDAYGRVTETATYDKSGNLTTQQDAMGNVTTYGHATTGLAPSGSLVSIKYQNNGVINYNYGAGGVVTSCSNALGHQTQFTYDANDNQLAEMTTWTDAFGTTQTSITSNIYDESDRIIYKKAPNGAVTTNIFNANGQVDHSIDAAGNVVKYTYDAEGRIVRIDYQDHTFETSSYDANGNRIQHVERSGRGTRTVYDSLNRVVESIRLDTNQQPLPDGNGGVIKTVTVLDLDGNIIQAIDANGNSVTYLYDSLGRKISQTSATGARISSQLDLNGRMISCIDPDGNTSRFSYDPNGRLTKTIFADGTFCSTEYDVMGNKAAETDQLGMTTRYVYDKVGRLIQVIDPMHNPTSYAYDEMGRRINQTDANGHTVTMNYDALGHLIQRTLPMLPTGYSNTSARSEYRTYDLLGRLAAVTDNNGLTTTFNYDPIFGYLLSKTGSNGDWVSFTYNSEGAVVQKSRGHGTATYNTITNSYDADTGRLRSVTGPNGTVAYEYDNAGNKIKTDVYGPDHTLSSETLLTYDADNRLSTVKHPGPTTPIAVYEYDNAGNLTSLTRGNGVSTTYTYDVLNRLTDLENSAGPSFHFTLRADGKRISITETGTLTPGTTNYQYDPNGRLISELETLTNGTVLVNNGYEYDNVGNRIRKTANGVEADYAYDANDRITNSGYSFDANGNQTTVNGMSATYDFENHLIVLGSANTPVAAYSYDADGNRLSTATSVGTVCYLVDTSTTYATVAEERDGGGNLIARYDYANELISMTRGGSNFYYVRDGHGNTRALTNASGSVTDTWAYDAFGMIAAPGLGSTENEFLYNSQQFDTQSASYYMRARYYSQADGRFLSTDPETGNLTSPVSLHRYSYANNDPAMFSDPSGRMSLVETLTVAGVTAILATIVGTQFLRTQEPNNGTLQVGLGVSDPAHETKVNWLDVTPTPGVSSDSYFTELSKFPGWTLATPSNVPPPGIGAVIRWQFTSMLVPGQSAFGVSVKQFEPQNHFFSVQTLSGHTLDGYRYWRIIDLPSNKLRIETVALEHPHTINDHLKNQWLLGSGMANGQWNNMLKGTFYNADRDAYNAQFANYAATNCANTYYAQHDGPDPIAQNILTNGSGGGNVPDFDPSVIFQNSPSIWDTWTATEWNDYGYGQYSG